MLPRSVDVVGDVGDPSTVKAAVSGCSKIIYCATTRSTITGDLNRVDNQGVRNVSKAFQDYYNELAPLRAGKNSKSKLLISKLKSAKSLKGWEVHQGSTFQIPLLLGSMKVSMHDLNFQKLARPFSQDLFSQEVDMLRYQKGFLFLWVPPWTGMMACFCQWEEMEGHMLLF